MDILQYIVLIVTSIVIVGSLSLLFYKDIVSYLLERKYRFFIPLFIFISIVLFELFSVVNTSDEKV